jgi:ACR3 family arsenite efflux pump ArsB
MMSAMDAQPKPAPTGAARTAAHVRKYLIAYTFLVAVVAVLFGYLLRSPVAANKRLLSDLVVVLAVITIYPSMVQLKTEGLLKTFTQWRAILLSVVYVFALAPVLAYLFAHTLSPAAVGTGFFVANVVPASSASLGYVLIAGGSIELATALALISFVASLGAIPLFLYLYLAGTHGSASVPMGSIVMSLVYVLVLPLVVGQITRLTLLRTKGKKFTDQTIKPHLSLATMLSMLALIFTLVTLKANLIVTKPDLVGRILLYQTIVIFGVLILSVFVSRLFKLSYQEHQAVAFISVTKNQSAAAAIATSSLSPAAGLAPATIPIIQPILAVAYLHLEKVIARFLGGASDEGTEVGAANSPGIEPATSSAAAVQTEQGPQRP